MTYLIPQPNMDKLQEKINVLNRKAKRLKCAPIVLSVVGTQMIKVEELGGIDLCHFEIEITGDSPIINGWSFISIVDHTEDGNILRSVPTMTHEGELVQFRHVPQQCEQCNTNRRRDNTFILRQNATGVYKQVGRTCLKDFLGHKSPEAMASYAELLSLAGDSCGAYEEGCAGRIDGIGTESYLRWVALAIRTYGWVSAKMVHESYEPLAKTSQTALFMIDDVRKDQDAPRPNNEDEKRVQTALTWIRELVINESTSDYHHNLWVACKSDSIPWKFCGTVASLFVAYDLAHKISRRTEKKVSQFQGNVDEEITRTLTLVRVNYCPGFKRGSVNNIYHLEDAEGNQYTWFTPKDLLIEGESYVIKGKVKKHDDSFRGIQTTILYYCAVLDTVKTGVA